MHIEFPPFRPHPLIRGGHLQTLAGAWWPLARKTDDTTVRWIDLPDGDRLALHDDAPPAWSQGGPVVLLVHGLAGCHASSYMIRIASRLGARGVRTLRLDLRGCGAGRGHARQPYHAGRWEDLEAAVQAAATLCPGSPLGMAGFSLGGNLLLRWLGHSEASGRRHVVRAIAVNPPIDLAACTRQIAAAARGAYDRHFTRLLYRQILNSAQWDPEGPLALTGRAPRDLVEFDDLFTAPRSGFENAAHYYRVASAAGVLAEINVPTVILSAADDPLIPPAILSAAARAPCVQLHLASGGGHLGYLAARGIDPDRHWLDWRVVEWLAPA